MVMVPTNKGAKPRAGTCRPAAAPELSLEEEDVDEDPEPEPELDPSDGTEADPGAAVPVDLVPASWEPEPLNPLALPAPSFMYFLAGSGIAGSTSPLSTSQLGAFLAGQGLPPAVLL